MLRFSSSAQKREQGFTLLEVLLGIAIAAFVIAALTGLLVLLLQSRERNAVVAEVEQQGEYALALVLQEARNADAFLLPVSGQTATSLSVDVEDASLDPLRFYVEEGVLKMQEGTGDSVALTNDRVTVSSLSVRNLAADSSPGTVRVSFELEYVSSSDVQSYAYTSTFAGSATLR
ncbi:MAG: prepilin-type N-terminal cleavage/methylation domain-containing protein [Candidatus Andersenbacteria bacterium]|nr:prepilin-type N-terminal cleavage/methylation domain-containing protein [Candidatus Andersenbacteria bacterium]